MATKYATLKDSNGDIIYPQISTDSITNGSITSSKINWATIFGDVRYKDQLTKSSNLNTLGDYLTSGTDGFYGFNMYTGSGGTGMPSENTNGILVVMSGPTYGVIVQFIIGGGVIYTRRYAGGAWGGWYKYAGTAI